MMQVILNKMFYYLKFLLLLICFASTFYIILFMYQRLDKNILESVSVFLPYVFVLTMFVINFIFDHKVVKDNFFYNFICCLVFALFIYVAYRALFDNFMIWRTRLGYDINFNYYNDMLSPLKIMLYALGFANIFLIFSKEKPKKNGQTENKQEVAVPIVINDSPVTIIENTVPETDSNNNSTISISQEKTSIVYQSNQDEFKDESEGV